MDKRIKPGTGTGANGKKFRKLDTVANYTGLSDSELATAQALINAPSEKKVEFIFELMATLRFQQHRTAKELSMAWNVQVNTVRAMCSRARDVFNFMAQHERSPESYRQEIQLRYEHLTNLALQAKKPMLKTDRETGEQEIVYADSPDIKAAITATKAIAELQAAHRNAVVEAHKNKFTDKDLDELVGLAKGELSEEEIDETDDVEKPQSD